MEKVQLFVPLQICDIQEFVEPSAEIHKIFGLKFHNVQIYGTIQDVVITRNCIKILLDDTSGQIRAFLDLPTKFNKYLEGFKQEIELLAENNDPLVPDFERLIYLAEESYFPHQCLKRVGNMKGSRAAVLGKLRRSIYKEEYYIMNADVTLDDGPNREKEIAFRKNLIDVYTKQFKRA